MLLQEIYDQDGCKNLHKQKLIFIVLPSQWWFNQFFVDLPCLIIFGQKLEIPVIVVHHRPIDLIPAVAAAATVKPA